MKSKESKQEYYNRGGTDSLSRCGDSSLREGPRNKPPSLREVASGVSRKPDDGRSR